MVYHSASCHGVSWCIMVYHVYHAVFILHHAILRSITEYLTLHHGVYHAASGCVMILHTFMLLLNCNTIIYQHNIYVYVCTMNGYICGWSKKGCKYAHIYMHKSEYECTEPHIHNQTYPTTHTQPLYPTTHTTYTSQETLLVGSTTSNTIHCPPHKMHMHIHYSKIKHMHALFLYHTHTLFQNG